MLFLEVISLSGFDLMVYLMVKKGDFHGYPGFNFKGNQSSSAGSVAGAI
jgi:hypothetical protein